MYMDHVIWHSYTILMWNSDSAILSRVSISPNHIEPKGGSFSKRRNCRELHDSLPFYSTTL